MKNIFKILKSKTFQIIIAALLLSFIIWKYDIELSNVFKYIKHYELIFAAIFIILFIKPFVFNRRWQIFLEHSGINESIFHLIKISWTSIFWTLFLPVASATDAFKMFVIEKKYPGKRGYAGATVFADRMIGFILFSLTASTGCLFLPASEEMGRIKIIIFISLFLVIAATLIIINNKVYEIITPLLNKISFLRFIFQYISKLHKSLTVLPYKKILPKVIPFMAAYQLANIFIAYLVFLSVGVQIPFYYHLVFIPIIQVITLLPLSVAGLGFREGVFIYFYKYLNIPAEISFSVSLIYFLLMVGIPSIIGGILILYDKIKIRNMAVR